ncbi:interferon-gamma-inducible GTPase 10-like [Erinaceus europaeus]|uniref:Interferon-gamma-inducible GTPase 10-like n=1 Tax=Erinaceus europaeus TaxID=9365 RepID=A0A1S3WGP3_ERIEU|nr:interferon-gamma-inducible GTPase 10-like [Erinaceus europaeus]
MGQSCSTPPSDTKNYDLASSFGKFFKDICTENKILSQETIALIQSHLSEGNIQDTASVIRDALSDIEKAPIDIAVTGETRAGKFSFINALRGVRPEEEGAAETGVVKTTVERVPYKHPKFPSVTVWDLPGIGTTRFPPHNYLQEMKFQEYDIFFIISAKHFTPNDTQLCVAIKKMRKNFYFVRTNVDSDLDKERVRKCRPLSPEEKKHVLQKIKTDCVTNLQKTKVTNSPVFLVSSFEVSGYDFPDLQTTLLRELPAYKRHIFMLSLPAVVEATMDRKSNSLKQKIWLDALKIRVPDPILAVSYFSPEEVDSLRETLTLYRSYFQLDDASLEQVAKDLHVSMVELKANLKSHCLLPIERLDESLGRMLWRCVPFYLLNGGLIATDACISRKFYLHNYLLDVVVSDAKYLLKKREILRVRQ